MQARTFSATNYKYGFNEMEKDDEVKGNGNSYDFGARIYDPRLGRTLSQDPHAARYPNMSPYSIMANNPILYIDADGKDIGVSTTFKEDGTKVISIVITGKLINNSSTAYTKEQMGAYADRLAEAIKKEYSIDVPGVETNVSVYITPIVSEVQLTETDHAFRIVDQGKVPDGRGGVVDLLGRAPLGENVVYLSQHMLDRVEATTGKFEGTGKTEKGTGTLERTGPHELGHSAALFDSNGGATHPPKGTMPGNLMNQTSEPDAGKNVTKDQILEIEDNHNQGKINKGKQKSE
jgi:RHS repeat-associated protein